MTRHAKSALPLKRGFPRWTAFFAVVWVSSAFAQVELMTPLLNSKETHYPVEEQVSQSGVRFRLGDCRYLARPVGKALGADFSNITSLATVVSIGAETDIDADFVKKNVEDFTTKDDVFREEFLEGIIIHGLNDSSVTIKVEKSELHEWNTEWIKGQFPGDQEGILRPGPYLIMSGVPYEVFRIMDDENKAFIQSTLTSKDSKTTFYPADDISDDDCAPGILVPSRLCADPSICYPLDGIRVAVKDVFHLDGMSTSLNSRPYRQAHSVQNYTASAISNLVSKGAHIVGKTRMSAFILQEHPTQNVNSVSPLNPRADGHQIPGGSSSGSAASVAAYDWLDVALGTDATGSMRIPALANGIFGFRMTTGILPVDGIVRLWDRFDALGAFARDLTMLRRFVKGWITGQRAEKQHLQVIYFDDFVPVVGEVQSRMIEEFAADLARHNGTEVRRVSIADHWASNPVENEADLGVYLFNATAHGFYYAAFHAFDEFRAAYREKYHKEPFISECVRWIWTQGSKVTLEEHQEIERRLDVFRDWFTKKFLSAPGANTIVVLPIAEAKPNYRDEYPALPTAPTPGLRNTDLSAILGAPELAVPIAEIPYQSRISGDVEMLPVVASLMGTPQMDVALIDTVLDFFNASGRATKVNTGKRMF
ncbi:hypothetical protein BFW01_g411 [Lasiodiplodia theobromae]|uniref:Amidase domain-containing protein n=1 Tax=Lasiodiplodia theobromae TaxID=45133 RepID=A0A8H7MAK2_9PEZI|nr:hypothetical protein BFW01_g411 [Lasiodiplodia theobromae]